MARGINKAILVGALGKDPEARYTAAGSAVVSFSIATNESWLDKNTNQKVEKTEWHNITAFGKLGEICAQYLKKGAQVYIEGKIQTDKYKDASGADKYSTKIIANEMQMLGGKPDNADQGQQHEQPTQSPAGMNQAPHGGSGGGSDDWFDDIPFAPVDGRYI